MDTPTKAVSKAELRCSIFTRDCKSLGWSSRSGSQRNPIPICGCQLHQCRAVEEAEASAVLLGLDEMSKYFDGHLIVETDCATVGHELQREGRSRSPWCGVITDIKERMRHFASVQISIVKRNHNKLAHEIAATAREYGNHFFLAEVHDNVRQRILSECNTTIT